MRPYQHLLGAICITGLVVVPTRTVAAPRPSATRTPILGLTSIGGGTLSLATTYEGRQRDYAPARVVRIAAHAGTRVVVTAKTSVGIRFLGWSGVPCNHRQATCTFTLHTSTSGTARFRSYVIPTPLITTRSTTRASLDGTPFTIAPEQLLPPPTPEGFFGPSAGPFPTRCTPPESLAPPAPRNGSCARVVLINGKAFNHPVAQALDGLGAISAYRSDDDPSARALAEIEGDQLIDTHTVSAGTGGAWWYPYDFTFALNGGAIARAPWYSGMAEGLALDLFTQLYQATGNAKWQSAARHTFASFVFPRSPGRSATPHPWITDIIGGSLWIQEYPTPNPTNDTINGFGYALVGIIDYAQTFDSQQAKLLAEAGLDTWVRAAALARNPGGVMSYSLSVRADRSVHYHLVVTSQLQYFAAITGDPRFSALATLLYNDYH